MKKITMSQATHEIRAFFGRVLRVLQSRLTTDGARVAARAVPAQRDTSGLRANTIIITAPTLREDGSILDRPGLDEAAGLPCHSEQTEPPRVHGCNNAAAALHAQRLLADRAAYVVATLTIVRQSRCRLKKLVADVKARGFCDGLPELANPCAASRA